MQADMENNSKWNEALCVCVCVRVRVRVCVFSSNPMLVF